jgi:hypothetical protein
MLNWMTEQGSFSDPLFDPKVFTDPCGFCPHIELSPFVPPLFPRSETLVRAGTQSEISSLELAPARPCALFEVGTHRVERLQYSASS